MEELNRRGKQFVSAWCDEVHGTTKRIPNQHYLLEEKQVLLPLPDTRYRTRQLQKRIVSNDSFISINGNKYSVPVRYVGRTLLFRIIYGFRIELYDLQEKPVLSLEAAARKFDQPTHHARKIMLLQDLYDDPVLDRFIGYCIDQDKMDIRSFKGFLRDYNAGKLELPATEAEKPACAGNPAGTVYRDDDPALIRDYSYYETSVKMEVG